MKQFLHFIFIILAILPSMGIAQVNERRIKELAALHVGDYCDSRFKCYYSIFPYEPDDHEIVVQVTRSVDAGGWPLFLSGDISIQMRFDQSGNFLSRKIFSRDTQPILE